VDQALPEPLMELHRAGDRGQFEGAMEAAAGDPAMEAMAAKRMEPYGTDSMFETARLPPLPVA
jgi:hypothetical protein